ncbi:MAG: periplasmic-type flagellar collar protein FlbB [Spirochaetota bacterium]
MKSISDTTKMIYLIILIVFIVVVGVFWLDYIGMINIGKTVSRYYTREAPSVVDAMDDEPSLIEREEFEKEKNRLQERIEDLDTREAKIVEAEKEIQEESSKLKEIKQGLELEKKNIEMEKKRYSGYKKNVQDLAGKIQSMPPDEAVSIMVQWEDPLIIDVLRQIDQDAAEAGTSSISSYLISLMPREKAGRIMYLMTQL